MSDTELIHQFHIKERYWMDQARCRGLPTSFFFPERGETTLPAQSICRTCPVRVECLEYAIRDNERFGIWWLSESQRRSIRRRVNTGLTTFEQEVVRIVGS